MLIAIDFDGTIVEESNYPNFGEMLPYAEEVILGLHEQHHVLVLFTLRDQKFQMPEMISPYLKIALDFLDKHNLKHCFKLPRDFEFHRYGFKFPFDFLIDDKACPNGKVDWLAIANRFNIKLTQESVCSK